MVTVTNYQVRESKEGKPFVTLELVGDVEMVQSATTGRFYATARKCSMSSTFTEEVAKTLVGKQIRGSIVRVESDQYEFAIPQTGEVILLSHRWDYIPEELPNVVEQRHRDVMV